MDFFKFRIYLKEKYDVVKAFMFIGYIEDNAQLYITLQKAGFECVFKQVIRQEDGSVKGNCDVDLTMKVLLDIEIYHKAVIVTGDGDFGSLLGHLIDRDKLEVVIIPNQDRFSKILKNKRLNKYLRYMNSLNTKLCLENKKGPNKDGTL